MPRARRYKMISPLPLYLSRTLIILLSIDTNTWEEMPEFAEDGDESYPCCRAGHTAAVVGTRMYVWSGRDGYKKVWNNQVMTGACCLYLGQSLFPPNNQCNTVIIPFITVCFLRSVVMTSGS